MFSYGRQKLKVLQSFELGKKSYAFTLTSVHSLSQDSKQKTSTRSLSEPILFSFFHWELYIKLSIKHVSVLWQNSLPLHPGRVFLRPSTISVGQSRNLSCGRSGSQRIGEPLVCCMAPCSQRPHSACLFWKAESHLHLHPLAGKEFTSRVSPAALVKYW